MNNFVWHVINNYEIYAETIRFGLTVIVNHDSFGSFGRMIFLPHAIILHCDSLSLIRQFIAETTIFLFEKLAILECILSIIELLG